MSLHHERDLTRPYDLYHVYSFIELFFHHQKLFTYLSFHALNHSYEYNNNEEEEEEVIRIIIIINESRVVNTHTHTHTFNIIVRSFVRSFVL